MSNPGPVVNQTVNSSFGIVTGTVTQQDNFSSRGTPLTNPNGQYTANVNNYCQVSNQNLSAAAFASSDHIVYPDNILSDGTGFGDMGICSSGFSQAAYSVTGPNDAYLFASAPVASSTSGDWVYATDSSGTSNSHRWYVNGFNKAIGLYSAKITGTGVASGMFSVCEGFATPGSSKVVSDITAATTYTIPAKCSYAYITTSGASLAVTYPAAAAAIDGLRVTLVMGTTNATTSALSTGATFVGFPASMTANVPFTCIYHHATLKWYPA